MSVLYHHGKANMLVDSLSCLYMGSASHVETPKRNLVKDVHRLVRLGFTLDDSSNGGFIVHCKSGSSLVVKGKSKQHLDQTLMELKESVLGKLNESFSLGGRVS